MRYVKQINMVYTAYILYIWQIMIIQKNSIKKLIAKINGTKYKNYTFHTLPELPNRNRVFYTTPRLNQVECLN